MKGPNAELTGAKPAGEASQNERLRAVLCKLVERDVTYWDSKGEVRHDVGTSQAEAMAIFREARALVTPNDQHNRTGKAQL